AFAHRLGQFGGVVGKVVERLSGTPFLTHEQQGNHGAEQLERDRRLERILIGQRNQPLAEGAVADLVVVLQKQNKGGGCEVSAGLAPDVTMATCLALEDKALAQKARQLGGG